MAVERSVAVVTISLDFNKPFAVTQLQRLGFKTGVAGRILIAKSATQQNHGIIDVLWHLIRVLHTCAAKLGFLQNRGVRSAPLSEWNLICCF